MEEYFPFLLILSGMILLIPVLMPSMRRKFVRMHPLKVSLKEQRRKGLMFLIVGLVWAAQNLLL